MRRAKLDPRDTTEAGERVPYIVAHSPNNPAFKLREAARRCGSTAGHLAGGFGPTPDSHLALALPMLLPQAFLLVLF
jgi:hypothetical protein